MKQKKITFLLYEFCLEILYDRRQRKHGMAVIFMQKRDYKNHNIKSVVFKYYIFVMLLQLNGRDNNTLT